MQRTIKLRYGWCIMVVIGFLFGSCTIFNNVKISTLENGRTKVPADNTVYANKAKFDKQLLHIVDTSVVYEEYNSYYKKSCRLDSNVETVMYGNYRFYPDGCLNLFSLHRKAELSRQDFDPSNRGYRGVYYLENGEIYFELFAEVTELGKIGKITGTLTFRGDTLYVNSKTPHNKSPIVQIYIKRELPAEYMKFPANW